MAAAGFDKCEMGDVAFFMSATVIGRWRAAGGSAVDGWFALHRRFGKLHNLPHGG